MWPDSLTVVTFKWKPSNGYRSHFGPETVNTLARMVKRHYPHPHRVVCVTDDAKGIDSSIAVIPLWKDLSHIMNPHGSHQPSCYRRLKAFSVEARDWFGERFVALDLDCVITADMTPLWSRTEDFIIWGSKTDKRCWYNGSMWMMTAGARKQVWETFNPRFSPFVAKRHGHFGSDQGWIGHILGKKEATWGIEDGVYSYRVHLKAGEKPLPPDARIVFFHGKYDPWHARCQRHDWVQEHYH